MSSRAQQNLYRAMIRSICEQMTTVGSQWNCDSWKVMLTYLFHLDTPEQGWPAVEIIATREDCKFVGDGIRTRDFTNARGALFVAFLDAWAVTQDINLEMEKI